MGKEILLSIIVPVYNVEDYVEPCLDSLCKQINSNIELIVVDDGSTDASGEICDRYIFKRARVIHKQNEGLVSARKRGVEEASGKYITFVDADDWVDDEWYIKTAKLIEKEEYDIVAYGCRKEYPNSSSVWNNKIAAGIYIEDNLKQMQEKALVDTNTFSFWNILPNVCFKIIRRELIEEHGENVDNDITFGEDATLFYPCLWDSRKLLVLEDAPYHYRIRSDSMSGAYYEISVESINKIKEGMLMTRSMSSQIKEQIDLYYYYLLLLRNYKYFNKFCLALFPFRKVNKGDRIVIYGAGGFGKSLYHYISENHIVNLVGVADQCADKAAFADCRPCKPEEISKWEYDWIILAILDENICEKIRNNLILLGNNADRIIYVTREDLLKY